MSNNKIFILTDKNLKLHYPAQRMGTALLACQSKKYSFSAIAQPLFSGTEVVGNGRYAFR